MISEPKSTSVKALHGYFPLGVLFILDAASVEHADEHNSAGRVFKVGSGLGACCLPAQFGPCIVIMGTPIEIPVTEMGVRIGAGEVPIPSGVLAIKNVQGDTVGEVTLNKPRVYVEVYAEAEDDEPDKLWIAIDCQTVWNRNRV